MIAQVGYVITKADETRGSRTALSNIPSSFADTGTFAPVLA